MVVLLVGLLATNAALATRFSRYRSEIARLRDGMTDSERRRADLVLASEQHRMRVALELVRRQARGDRELHLAVNVDSGRMYLEREGVLLREMDVLIGTSRPMDTPTDTVHLVAPRGARTVTHILTSRDAWDIPPWVFTDRALTMPDNRSTAGALGAVGIVLSGGTVIYARPAKGPLSDSAYVLPGSVLAAEKDLRAIAPNIVPGMTVYFY